MSYLDDFGIEEDDVISSIGKNLSEQLASGKHILEEINELETSYSSAQLQVQTKEDEVSELKEILGHARNCMLNFQKQISELQIENEALSNSCLNLNDENFKNIGQIDYLLGENQVLKKQISSQVEELKGLHNWRSKADQIPVLQQELEVEQHNAHRYAEEVHTLSHSYQILQVFPYYISRIGLWYIIILCSFTLNMLRYVTTGRL